MSDKMFEDPINRHPLPPRVDTYNVTPVIKYRHRTYLSCKTKNEIRQSIITVFEVKYKQGQDIISNQEVVQSITEQYKHKFIQSLILFHLLYKVLQLPTFHSSWVLVSRQFSDPKFSLHLNLTPRQNSSTSFKRLAQLLQAVRD